MINKSFKSFMACLPQKKDQTVAPLVSLICCMPKVGIEPTFPKERDFESRASASSATPA